MATSIKTQHKEELSLLKTGHLVRGFYPTLNRRANIWPALKPMQKVLIVDDLIATGRSARAAIDLIRQTGGDPVELISLLEVKGLKDREKLDIPSFKLFD